MIYYLKKYWLQHIALIIYVIALLYIIPKHEPWEDEAQAWLLARDSGLVELLFKNIGYEGHPGLWHVILMIPSRLLEYSSFGYISFFFSLIGVFLILYYSSFPLWVKLIIPFTYFIFYQYSVVARCYSLILPLLGFIALLYREKNNKIYLFVFFVSLLANVSLHGFIIALALMFVHFVDVISFWKNIDKADRKTQLFAFVIFAIVCLFVVLQVYPPDDLYFSHKGFSFSFNHFLDLGLKIIGEVFSGNLWLSYFVIVIFLIWFYLQRQILFFVLSNIAMLLLFSIYYNFWHQGVLYLIWIFTLWLSFSENKGRLQSSLFRKVIKILMLVSTGIVCVFNTYWSLIIYKNEIKMNYGAGKEISTFIKENGLENKFIYATNFWSLSILPYFEKNIFRTPSYKDGKSYWVWTKQTYYPEENQVIISKKPDLIIFSRPEMFSCPSNIDGYKFVNNFFGNVLWKDSIKEVNDYRMFLKESMKFFIIPEITKPFLQSLNTFENNITDWNYNAEMLSAEVKYSGKKSNIVNEFSLGFECNLDSVLLKNNFNSLIISSNAYCYFTDKTSALLVVSIETENKAYIWEGIEIEKYIKAYSNWWPVRNEITIDRNKIKAKSKLKIYIWNPDKQKGYVDNFDVKIFLL